MNVVIALIAGLGLLALAASGVVAYRWSRGRAASAAGNRVEWPASRTEPDTQAGRI